MFILISPFVADILSSMLKICTNFVLKLNIMVSNYERSPFTVIATCVLKF